MAYLQYSHSDFDEVCTELFQRIKNIYFHQLTGAEGARIGGVTFTYYGTVRKPDLSWKMKGFLEKLRSQRPKPIPASTLEATPYSSYSTGELAYNDHIWDYKGELKKVKELKPDFGDCHAVWVELRLGASHSDVYRSGRIIRIKIWTAAIDSINETSLNSLQNLKDIDEKQRKVNTNNNISVIINFEDPGSALSDSGILAA